MKNVFWRSGQDKSKGFVFSLDAILCCMIIIGLTSGLVFLLGENQNLNDVFLYQQAQDIVEVCSKKELSSDCFDFLIESNPSLSYCLNNCSGNERVLIKRNYPEELEFGVTLTTPSSK